jgi:hypothetical protein
MSWIQTVLQLTEPLGADKAETPALARRRLRSLNADTWTRLKACKAAASRDGVLLSLVQLPVDDLHDYLTEDEVPGVGQYEVRVAKTAIPDRLRFLDSASARVSASANPGDFEAITILELADIEAATIISPGLTATPWHEEVPAASTLLFGSPAKAVRDYAKAQTVPRNVGTWLMVSEPDGTALHSFFGPLATQRLALCLPNSVEGEPLHLVARLDGKIKAVSPVEPTADPVWSDPALYRALSEACFWIYSEPKESSNKHALLSGEIARASTEGKWGAGLASTLNDALSSAQIAYRLHLQEKGVDALKLMADLRKGVAEDVRGVTSQISALSAALWRDAAVALGAVALRNTGAVGDLVPFLVAIYLNIGGYLTGRWADRTVKAIEDNELAFRRSLYAPLLSDRTYNDLALSRYADIFREFKAFRRAVAAVYFVAIVVVLATVLVPLFLADAGGARTLVLSFLGLS